MNHRLSDEDFQAAIEAAEQRGAETAVAELIAAAHRATASAAGYTDEDFQRRMFIGHFCGGIQGAFPELAILIGNSVKPLYSASEIQLLLDRANRIRGEVELFSRA